jgi:Protein of unknown function (DUF1499)
MNYRLLLLCLLLSACGIRQGTGSLVAQPVDMHTSMAAPGKGSALAAPADWKPAPDIVTPTFNVPASRLFAAVKEVAAARPRTYLQVAYPEQMQAFYIVRSLIMNFPDLVIVQAFPAGPKASTLVMFSHARYGSYEFDTNGDRLTEWLKAVDAKLKSSLGQGG